MSFSLPLPLIDKLIIKLIDKTLFPDSLFPYCMSMIFLQDVVLVFDGTRYVLLRVPAIVACDAAIWDLP